jgi:hypothetical protein
MGLPASPRASPPPTTAGATPDTAPPARSATQSARLSRSTLALIATVVIAIIVVLVVLLTGIVPGVHLGSTNSSPKSLGTFSMGNPVSSLCRAGGVANAGCATYSDITYTVTVESSSVTFGSVLFEVRTSTGSVFVNAGTASFALKTASGTVAAYSTISPGAGLSMPTTWTTYEGTYVSATPLTELYTIVIDTGQAGSSIGLSGLSFVAIGTGSYSGTSAPLSLPTAGITIGSAFAVGNPVASQCTPALGKADLCVYSATADHYIYTLTVESSTITFSSALFEVKTPTGAVYGPTGGGGFAIQSESGVAVAYVTPGSLTALAMTSLFSLYSTNATACNGLACTSSTPMTNIYAIVIDVGTANPTGDNYVFVAIGAGSYVGMTSPLALP